MLISPSGTTVSEADVRVFVLCTFVFSATTSNISVIPARLQTRKKIKENVADIDAGFQTAQTIQITRV